MSICSAFNSKNVLSREVCDKLVKQFEPLCIHDSHSIKGNLPYAGLRSRSFYFIPKTPDNSWIYQTVHDIFLKINSDVFKLDVTDVDTVQLVMYEKDHFHDWHIDLKDKRKLSMSIELSESSEYEGGKLTFGLVDTRTYTVPNVNKGDATLFTSVTRHKVSPVTRGKRCALIAWMNGPPYK